MDIWQRMGLPEIDSSKLRRLASIEPLLMELEASRKLCAAAIAFESAWGGFGEDTAHHELRNAIHNYQTAWKDHPVGNDPERDNMHVGHGQTVWTIEDIKAANHYWFDDSAMQFWFDEFRSGVSAEVYQGAGGVYLVSSSKTHKYSVWRFDPATGAISTASELNSLSREAAHRLAAKLCLANSEQNNHEV